MAAGTMTGIIVSQRWAYNGGWTEYSETEGGFAGTHYSSGVYYTNLIQFRTPAFGLNSVSGSITFSLWASNNNFNYSHLRYAICTSDVNRDMYCNTYAAVNDTYQVVSGDVSLSNIPSASGTPIYTDITIKTGKLKPSTTYYFYLWAYQAPKTCPHIALEGSKYHKSVTVSYYEPYKLNITADDGSTVIVNRTHSSAAATGNISAGSSIYADDLLKISFIPASNYKIITSTVNGNHFASGNTHVVTGNVSIESRSEALASGVRATDAAVGSTSIINISSSNSAYKHILTYSFEGVSGSITSSAVEERTISWTIPSSFYDYLTSVTSAKCTIICETYNGSTLIGTSSCNITVSIPKDASAPDVTGRVIDVNDVTVGLTGDDSVLVRYCSTAECTIGATAKNSASITKKTINGIEVDDTNTVIIQEVEDTSFTFSATDSRGYTSSTSITPKHVPYVKLTINPTIKRPVPTTGEITLSFKGNYYNGSFGKKNNTLTIRYRYRLKTDGAFGSWKTVSSSLYTIGTETYRTDAAITIGSEFDYQQAYVFEINIFDQLTDKTKTITVQPGLPTFDWGQDDFNFNVDVKIKERHLIDYIYPVGAIYIEYSVGVPGLAPSELRKTGATWEKFEPDTTIHEYARYWRRVK